MMSKPAVQNITAAVSHRMRGSSDPRTAIHAAAGAMPKERPRIKCEKEVKRLVNEEKKTTAKATGASLKHNGFKARAASRNTRTEKITKPQANWILRIPAGMWRRRVR